MPYRRPDRDAGRASRPPPGLAGNPVVYGRVILVFLVLLGATLRWLRFDLRFNQIAFAYAAYYQPVVSALEAGHPAQALTTFVGLHPPLYSFLFAALYFIWGAPAGYLAMSAAFSTGAIVATYALGREAFGPRVGLGAAALMAVSVYQCHYALEINNYPLLTLVATLGHWAFLRMLRRPDGPSLGGWIAVMTAGLYTHALVAPLLAIQVTVFLAWHRTRYLARIAAATAFVGALCVPMVPPVIALLQSGGTYQNTPVPLAALWSTVAGVMWHRFGPEVVSLLLVSACLVGGRAGLKNPAERRATVALLASLAMIPCIALLILGQVASAEQYPYYLVVLAPTLVLAARGLTPNDTPRPRSKARRPAPAWLLVFACLAEMLFGWQEIREAWLVVDRARSRPHAITLALHRPVHPRVLWLIAPPLYPDDDKRAVDPVYLELPRWTRCRYHGLELGFEYVNYAFGQPVACGDLVLHTFTDIYPSEMHFLLDHYTGRGDLVSIVMYDVGVSPNYVPRLENVLAPYDVTHAVVGGSHLYTVRSGAGP